MAMNRNCHEAVERFARGMEIKLHDYGILEALDDLEVGFLVEQMLTEMDGLIGGITQAGTNEAVESGCYGVANYAMLIADRIKNNAKSERKVIYAPTMRN